jgi:hypothetical protein
MPPTVTTTLPLAAPDGAGTTILDADHVVGVPAAPLNVTVLAPWVAPKLAPVIVTGVPTLPLVGERLVRIGAAVVVVTVKGNALLAIPPTVTITLPVVAPEGTGTTILVADQLVGVAVVPLNVTALVPWVVPKLFPAIVTDAPTFPLVGERLVRVGAAGAPPVAARKAATAAPHPVLDDSVAVAAIAPGAACRRSSTISLVRLVDTRSSATNPVPGVIVELVAVDTRPITRSPLAVVVIVPLLTDVPVP